MVSSYGFLCQTKASSKRGKAKTIHYMSSKYMWEIKDFYTCCDIAKVGNVVESPKFFTSLGHRIIAWKLWLYPKGQSPDYKDNMSLYLHTPSKVKIEAAANFKILNKNGHVVQNCELDIGIFDCNNACGTGELISTDFILNQANCILTPNGKLKIICEITTMPRYKVKELKPNNKPNKKNNKNNKKINKKNNKKFNKKNNKKPTNIEVPEATSQIEALDIYEELMNDGKFSDVTLVVENRKLRVHKCILGKNSSVFAAMFATKMQQNQQIVVEMADDIKYHVLIEMIRFVYTGKVNSIEKIVGELAIVAKKYALHRLVILCEKTMIKNMNSENVINCLLFADKLKLNNLKMKAIELIIENGRDVIDQQQFRLLPYDVVLEVCSTLAKKYKQ